MSAKNARIRLDAISGHLNNARSSPLATNDTAGDTWEDEVAELNLRRKLAAVFPEDDPGIQRQRDQGKLLVRERINAMIDAGSWQEIGSAAGFPVYDKKTNKMTGFNRTNFVQGLAKVDGQLVYVGADDFSVRGGSADGAILSKYNYGESLAREVRQDSIDLPLLQSNFSDQLSFPHSIVCRL